MRDRLKSVKFSRTIRNLSLCLSLVFFLEFVVLLLGGVLRGTEFLQSSLIFLFLAVAFGFTARYYHARFRNRD